MKILFKNANIITMDGRHYQKGELFVKDDTIVFVGENYKGNLTPDKVIDANKNILMPGFINAHTHTAMTILKNTVDHKNLHDWLFEDILPKEEKLTSERVYDASMLGIAEYIKNGITTFGDAYYYPEATAKAVVDSGIRAVVSVGFHPNDIRKKEDLELQIKNLLNKNDRLGVMLYAHSIYTVDEAQMKVLIDLAHKYKLLLYTHMSETLKEVSDCNAKFDLTPTQLLEELGFFDVPASVAHGVFVEKEDMEILSRYNVNVVSNPASNLKLGSGIAPLYAMQKRGINLALGTDGACSNNALDMFREMYLSNVLQKALLNDASIMTAEETLKMATINGAKALKLDNVGLLKEGYKADIIMLDVHTPNLTPLNNELSAIVYSASAGNVALTMVNGTILYENGKFYLNEEIETILEKAKNESEK